MSKHRPNIGTKLSRWFALLSFIVRCNLPPHDMDAMSGKGTHWLKPCDTTTTSHARSVPLMELLCTNTGYLTNMYRIHKLFMWPNSPYKLTVFISLLLAGDIELNPGPVHPPMYPCAVCQLGVNWSDQAIACDDCDVWIHKSCASMDSATYANMENWLEMLWM